LSTKFIAFSGNLTDQATAGMDLVGSGRQTGHIVADVSEGSEELQVAATTDRLKTSDRERRRGGKGGSR
jgi:hypothetical protein